MGQGGAVEHVHGKVGRRAVVQLDDAGADVSGLVVGQGPVPGEVPRAGAGEEVQRQPGADVDAVQLVGVLVAELAGEAPAAGAGEESSGQPGADVDAVQLVGVLVAELAGDDPADVAAPSGVLLV